VQNNWVPPTNKIIQIVEAQPCTGSLYTNLRTTMSTMDRNEIKHKKIPTIVEIVSGNVEKAIMPSKE